MAAQYWRAVALQSYDGRTLRLSEFQLSYLGNRLDGAATLTSSIAPSDGALANLKDDNLNTYAEWTGSAMRNVVLSWDFGSAVNIDDIVIGTHNDTNKSLLSCGLQYASSPAGPWTEFKTYNNIWCPGVGAKSVSSPTCLFDPIGSMLAGSSSLVFTALDATRTQMIAATGPGVMRVVTQRTAGVLQFEMDIAWAAATQMAIGIQLTASSAANTGLGWYLTPGSGSRWANGGQFSGYCTPFGTSGSWTVGVVVDFTAGSLTFYKNGVSLGVAFTGLALTAGLLPVVCPGSSIGTGPITVNLRTSNFNFPIAGATPWDSTTSIFTLWKSNVGPTPDVTGYALSTWNALSAPPDFTKLGNTTLNGQGRSIGNYIMLNVWEDPYQQSGNIVNITWGKITGTVTVAGVPAKRRVRLFRDIDSQCFGEQWSNPLTGYIEFPELPKKWKFTGVAEDYTGTYQWLIWNGVYPA